MAKKTELDRSILEAALDGLEHRLETIQGKIAEVKTLLSRGHRGRPAKAEAGQPAKPARKKRRMSAAARKRIAEAQRLRWQQFRAAQKAGAKRAKAAGGEGQSE